MEYDSDAETFCQEASCRNPPKPGWIDAEAGSANGAGGNAAIYLVMRERHAPMHILMWQLVGASWAAVLVAVLQHCTLCPPPHAFLFHFALGAFFPASAPLLGPFSASCTSPLYTLFARARTQFCTGCLFSCFCTPPAPLLVPLPNLFQKYY